MRRRVLAGAAVVAAVVAAAAAYPGGGNRSAAEVAAAPPLRVDGRLPAWRAPGTPVAVTGFAGGGERLLLLAGGRRVAGTTAGPLGRFSLRFAAPAPGRYPLVLQGEGRTRPLGRLRVRQVVLEAVGDVTFGEDVGPALTRYGGAYPWAGVASTLRSADVTVGNLETAVSTRGVAAAKEFTFRGPPHALGAMRARAGFDVLTLANNHSADYGRDALLDTLRHVRAAGILPVGAGANEPQARRPAVVVAGGLRIAVLGYSDVNPLGFPATATTPGTARAEPEAIAADVRAARRRADVVVCFFHWGVELRPEPDGRQQRLAAACLNAGAKLVLGAHPHVLGPLSRPTRSALVAWTLGNFVFPSSGRTAKTAILRVHLDRRGVRGFRLLPVTIDGFRPRLDRP